MRIYFVMSGVAIAAAFFLLIQSNPSASFKSENSAPSNSTQEPLKKSSPLKAFTAEKPQLFGIRKRHPSAQAVAPTEALVANPILTSTRWKIWPHKKAIAPDLKNENDLPLVTVGNFIIVESTEENSSMTDFNLNSPVVVFDGRMKKTGIITGTLTVRTLRKDLLMADLASLNAAISDEFENINTYFVISSEQRFNLELLYLNIKSKSYVEHVELEILSKTYEKF